jgi:hypothetical protein
VRSVGRRTAVPEHAQTGPTVEDKLRAIGSDEFKTRRIAAEAPGRGIDGGRGTSDTPKAEFGDGGGHIFRRTGLAQSSRVRVEQETDSMVAAKRGKGQRNRDKEVSIPQQAEPRGCKKRRAAAFARKMAC